jgi:Tfp pilus assembly protein PilF
VQAVREASLAEPESLARRMAWARSLSIAGRDEEAWSVLSSGPAPGDTPRVATERAELAVRAGRDMVAQELLRALAVDGALCESQRIAALGVALRLPRASEGRRALCAAIARPLLGERDIAPTVLAAAMLDGADADAAKLALEAARPWSAAVVCEGAQMLIDEGLLARAVSLLRAARARAERGERAALLRAEVATLAALGDDAAALAEYRAERERTSGALLVEEEPSSEARELNELAGCFLLCDRSEAAMRLFELAIAADPAMSEPLNNLAWLRLLAGRIGDDAAELGARALAASPDEPSTLDTVAWLGYLRGDPIDTVVERLRRATAGANPGLEPTDHLGDALWQAGDRAGATDMWRIVAESASGRASRALIMEAFDRMQRRRWGVRAWDAGSFYDARDGAAIRRAQAKLKAVAEGAPPPVAPRPPVKPSVPAPATPDAPAPTP